MINRTTGELHFITGQDIRPAGLLPPQVREESYPCRGTERIIYSLGIWHSDHGPFLVGVAVDADMRICGALLCHWVKPYCKRDPGDPERCALHESVIGADLGAQREFSWGRVDCRQDEEDNRNWLLVGYAPGSHIPNLPPRVFGHLYARESEYHIEDDEALVIDRHSRYTIDRTQPRINREKGSRSGH